MTMTRLLAAAFLFLVFPELQGAGVRPGGALMGVSSLTGPARAEARSSRAAWPGPFPVEVLGVKDGDTLEVLFADGPCGRAPCPRQETALRIYGIDAPEIHTCRGRKPNGACAACPAELAAGARAKAATEAFIYGAALRASDLRPDKYGGRVVGDLQALKGGRWVSLSTTLLDAKLAIPYDGGRKKKPWCRKVK